MQDDFWLLFWHPGSAIVPTCHWNYQCKAGQHKPPASWRSCSAVCPSCTLTDLSWQDASAATTQPPHADTSMCLASWQVLTSNECCCLLLPQLLEPILAVRTLEHVRLVVLQHTLTGQDGAKGLTILVGHRTSSIKPAPAQQEAYCTASVTGLRQPGLPIKKDGQHQKGSLGVEKVQSQPHTVHAAHGHVCATEAASPGACVAREPVANSQHRPASSKLNHSSPLLP
jgi:hypothetical protein